MAGDDGSQCDAAVSHRNVPFSQTVDLVQRLRAQHVPFEQMILPDEIHGFLMWRSWMRAYAATAEFFDRTLKRGEKIGAGDWGSR